VARVAVDRAALAAAPQVLRAVARLVAEPGLVQVAAHRAVHPVPMVAASVVPAVDPAAAVADRVQGP
jgi:hypothetical protein